MNFNALVSWAQLGVSLANTVLLFWLGLTILLNAERRRRGILLIVSSLLIGGIFFISHTAILGNSMALLDRQLEVWWSVGLAAVIALPFVWYVVTLWYGGFWEDPAAHLHRRHRIGLMLAVLLIFLVIALLVLLNPLPYFLLVLDMRRPIDTLRGGLQLLIALYTSCTILCIGLSLDALLHPGPSRRLMGDLARARARPWLLATSVTMLFVGLLVAAVMVWLVDTAGRTSFNALYSTVSWFDLLIETLISAGVIFVGQAVVHYEVFTGKTLPQRRFMRHWRNVIILAFGYGIVMGGGFVENFQPIYTLMLMALSLTGFYALANHNSYLERERYMRDLRPFVSGQNWLDHLIAGSVPAEAHVWGPFTALCRDVLSAEGAYLIAVGPSAPLMPPLAYPATRPIPAFSLGSIGTPDRLCIPIDPTQYGDAMWAIPLWSDRGLIGVLLLCEKVNGGLYTQEEIEIARATGERLIDTQASVTISRRLMTIQRQRLAEGSVIDRQTRRVLHDEVLPTLHTAMLTMPPDQVRTVNLLADTHRQISDLLHDMPTKVEITSAGLVDALRRTLDGELRGAFDSITWQIGPEVETRIGDVPTLMTEVIYYAAREVIRNAARYGRGNHEALRLYIVITWCDGLQLAIEDDGVGIIAGESHGNGHGLALHSTMMAVIGGTLTVESASGQYTRVVLSLPHEAW
jgi:hypothetical protein